MAKGSRPGENLSVDYSAVARVASSVELRDVRLVRAHTQLHGAPNAVPDDWTRHAFVGFESLPGEWNDESETFAVTCSFLALFKNGWDPTAEGPRDFSPEDPPDVEMDVEFELVYEARSREGITAEDLVQFATANGTLHAWPYWRELAGSATQRMRIPPLVVGVFKIPSDYDPREETDESI